MIRPVKGVTVDAGTQTTQNQQINEFIRQARQVIPRRLQGLDAMAQVEHADDDQGDQQHGGN